MEELVKLRQINKLKEVYRFAAVGKRKESSAEHSWSALIVADYLLSRSKLKLDRSKVYELIMYHDLAEIEAGDNPLNPNVLPFKKYKEKETKAAKNIAKSLPAPLNKKYLELFEEFEEGQTKEAQFAKLVDAIDADLHELDYPQDWKGWTEEYYLSKRENIFKKFPELSKLLNEFINYLKKHKYII